MVDGISFNLIYYSDKVIIKFADVNIQKYITVSKILSIFITF